MVNVELIVPALELVQLGLRGHELSADHVHLLRRRKVLGGGVVCFSGRRGLSKDVVESILVVHFEIGVLELPGLRGVGQPSVRQLGPLHSASSGCSGCSERGQEHTPGP